MSDGVEAFGYKQELKRSLSLFDLLVYGLVFIVPVAPVAVFGIVYNASKGMVPLIYTIGLAAMVFSALSYMSLSRVYPVAGSAYTYVSHTLGQMMGFLAGWAMLLDYLLLPTLTYVVCAIAVHASFPTVSQPLCVVALIALSTTLNYFGIETTARASFVLLVLQLILLAAFFVLGCVALAHGTAGAHLALTPLFNPAVLTPGLIFGALSLAVLSFLGFDAISTLSEEAAGGPAAIAKATILSLCLCAALFVAQTYLASLFVLGKTQFPPGAQTDEAFYNIAAIVGGGWFKFTLTVPGVLISGIAGALAAQAATARLLYSMARDGKLPRLLAHVHPVRKVPESAVFLVAAITLVLGVTMVDKLELLTSMVSFGALLGFLLVHAAVLAQFRNEAQRQWFRHVISPAIGFVIIGYVLWNAEANAKIAGLAWLVMGAVLFVITRLRGRSAALPLT
jgi:amino acid transporter